MLALTALGAGVAHAGSRVLAVSPTIQQQDQWCWAAVTQCVQRFYGQGLSQCEIAEYTRTHSAWHYYGPVSCCVSATQGCNYPNYLYGDPGSVEGLLSHWGTATVPYGSPLSLQAASTEIDSSHPFIFRWAWDSGGGHFLVAHGYSDSMLHYMNPWPGEGLHVANYNWLLRGVDHTWTHTLTTGTSLVPLAPSIISPAGGAVLNGSQPTITGSAEAQTTVVIYLDGSNTASGGAATSSTGTWAVVPALTLGDGPHSVLAIAINAAGISSPPSPSRVFSIDTRAPAAPVIASPASGAFVSTGRPTIAGTAEARSVVRVSFDGNPVAAGSVTAGTTGSWSFVPATALSEGLHSVQAIATDGAGNISPASPASAFTIDTRAPSAPTITSPASGTFVSTGRPTIAGTAEAQSVVRVSFDGSPVVAGSVTTSATGSWSFAPATTLPDGRHSVRVTATDRAGNISPASPANAFTIDTNAPPAPSLTAPASGAFVSTGRPTIAGTAEARSVVRVSFDGNPVAAGSVTAGTTGSWSFVPATALSEGLHSVQAVATDEAGNISPASPASVFTVDTKAPAAPVISSPTGGVFVNTGRPTVTGTAEAQSVVRISFDGSPAGAGSVTAGATGSWSFVPATTLPDGLHSVQATATDRAGNISPASPVAVFTVDTRPPVTPVVTSPINGALVNTGLPIISGSGEARCSVKVYFDRSPVPAVGVQVGTGTTWAFMVSGMLADGPHTVQAVSVDAAGNSSSPSPIVSFTIDATAPAAPAIISPPTGIYMNDGRPTISGTAEAQSVVRISFEGSSAVAGTVTAGATGTWSFRAATVLPDGLYSVRATATDKAGNTSLASPAISFTVDTKAPVAPVLTAPTSGAFVNAGRPAIAGTAEAQSTIRISFDGSPAVAGTVTVSITGSWSFLPATTFSDGLHSVRATATDRAGNIGPASTANSFTVDTKAPVAPVLTAPASRTFVSTGRPSIMGSAEAQSVVRISFDGSPTGAGTVTADATGGWSFVPATSLPDGLHLVEAAAADRAGNVSSTSLATSFTVDTKAPAAPVLTAPAGGTFVKTGRPTITGTAEAQSAVRISFDGSPTGAGTVTADATGRWSFTPATNLPDGLHSVGATATDRVGNIGPASASQFTIDTKAPTPPVIVSPARGASVSTGRPTITGRAEAHSMVSVFFDHGAVAVTLVTADGSGAWSYQPAEALVDGDHSVRASAMDAAGNVSSLSPATNFSVLDESTVGCNCASSRGDASLALVAAIGVLLSQARPRMRRLPPWPRSTRKSRPG